MPATDQTLTGPWPSWVPGSHFRDEAVEAVPRACMGREERPGLLSHSGGLDHRRAYGGIPQSCFRGQSGVNISPAFQYTVAGKSSTRESVRYFNEITIYVEYKKKN